MKVISFSNRYEIVVVSAIKQGPKHAIEIERWDIWKGLTRLVSELGLKQASHIWYLKKEESVQKAMLILVMTTI
jgi:hypothetical protein